VSSNLASQPHDHDPYKISIKPKILQNFSPKIITALPLPHIPIQRHQLLELLLVLHLQQQALHREQHVTPVVISNRPIIALLLHTSTALQERALDLVQLVVLQADAVDVAAGPRAAGTPVVEHSNGLEAADAVEGAGCGEEVVAPIGSDDQWWFGEDCGAGFDVAGGKDVGF
jgi:hypothetical protein